MAVADPGGLLEPIDLAAFGPVIPVIVFDRAEQAVPMARASVDGGVRVLEVTLRTAAALRAIEAIAREVPEAIVGAGTLRSAADARSAHAAGARFGVSPGYSAAVAEACRELGLPLLPGVATATEVMQAADDGFRFLKFFPASAAGGPALLKAWASPFADIAFCPTGGVGIDSAPSWLALPNVKVVGGSWLTPAEAFATGDWERITRLPARRAACAGRELFGAGRRGDVAPIPPAPERKRFRESLNVALDQLDLVAVGVGDEGDHRRSALHRPGLARHRAAAGADPVAGRLGVGDADGDVAEGGAEVVLADAVVVGELDLGLLRIRAVADEGQRVLLLRPLGRAQELHAHDLCVEVDRALQVADAKHRVEESHGVSRRKQVVEP
jgi:2-dehydro-3-deoxyphosphogluconate aldolase/(4S)-4-hydroxy-2-oxoglutarate aldolase